MLSDTSPIALQRDEGEALWFLGLLAIVKAAGEATNGRFAVIEHLAPQDWSRRFMCIGARTNGFTCWKAS